MNEQTQNQIQVGQTVTATFAWREDELPTDANFYTGKVLQIVERAKNCFYVRISGLNQLMPMDRVQAA